jgi:uncharacterized peroxidase-related enzyme
MPRIPPLSPLNAPPEIRRLYDEIARRMSFPAAPNFFTIQGHSAAASQGTWDLVRNVLVSGEIPRWTKEMMFVAISKARNCKYCEAAHLACCRMLGVNQKLLASLVHDINEIQNPKLREMILFAVKCSKEPQQLAEADFEKLHQHGLPKSEVMEIIAMSALAVYASIIANATAVEPDTMFG